jgi:saccharopine dehydrogenase (NAD+, L-lysine-forming)
MVRAIGIRREDKNPWERRVPLVPSQVAHLIQQEGLRVYVQPSDQRVFPDEAYRGAGAVVQDDLGPCPVILGVKEIPAHAFEAGKTYLFFSHTIKGQCYNMPMLRTMMDRGCQLIDYERIVDGQGRRLVFFGRHAGLAGMMETLRALGKRLAAEGLAEADNPFLELKQPWRYENLSEAKAHLAAVGQRIRTRGLAPALVPLTVGFLGYGNVSRGAQEILDYLPVEEITPQTLLSAEPPRSDRTLYKIVFREEDTVVPEDDSEPFSLSDYLSHPIRYRAAFERFLPRLTVLVNGIYWDREFPVLVTNEAVRKLYAGATPPGLRVIGDITCDIEGSIAMTRKDTLPDEPCYVYDTEKDRIVDGISALPGPVIMAVGNLPTEFPVEASTDFGRALLPFIGALASADFRTGPGQVSLPDPIHKALILHRGLLTEPYLYLEKFVTGEMGTCQK